MNQVGIGETSLEVSMPPFPPKGLAWRLKQHVNYRRQSIQKPRNPPLKAVAILLLSKLNTYSPSVVMGNGESVR